MAKIPKDRKGRMLIPTIFRDKQPKLYNGRKRGKSKKMATKLRDLDLGMLNRLRQQVEEELNRRQNDLEQGEQEKKGGEK